MSQEIERKFLLISDDWKSMVSSSHRIQQGYLNSDPLRTVRIRIIDDNGVLTIKGKNEGISRLEFEYDIPIADAKALINLCEKPLIDKIRNLVKVGSHTWEIDEFAGANEGLVLAEVEIESEDSHVDLPSWIGEEVSHDSRYYNSNLFKNPIKLS